jgi:hypothetical protein
MMFAAAVSERVPKGANTTSMTHHAHHVFASSMFGFLSLYFVATLIT